MKQRLRFFLLLSVLWLCLFFISRNLFPVYQFPQTNQPSVYEILRPMVHSFRMDLAMKGNWLLMTGIYVENI